MNRERLLIVSERARKDLRSIARYTKKKWGEEQKDKYIASLFAGMERIRVNPDLGRKRGGFVHELLSYRIEKHYIFYIVDDDDLSIVAILHSKMDPSLHIDLS